MRAFLWLLAVLGMALFGWSVARWVALGLAVDVDSLTTAAGKKPWSLDKDSPLIFLVLGAALVLYTAFELFRRRKP